MRNLLFVLVFVSITIFGCGGNKSPLEKCAETKLENPNYDFEEKIDWEDFHRENIKEKIKAGSYEYFYKICEKERMVAPSPKTFDVKWQ